MTETKEMKKGKFSLKGNKENGSPLEQSLAPDMKTKAAVVEDDDSSTTSEGGSKSFFGFEKKKPRAEFRAEIEELKYQLEQANSDLRRTKDELQVANQKIDKFQKWAQSAPL